MWFLCPSRPSTWVHRIPQRNNSWPHQSLSYPWSPFTTNSAPIGEPPRQGQLPLLLRTRVCNKILRIHSPAPYKNPLYLGSASTRIIWCTQTSLGFCTIFLSTKLHLRLHSLCVNLRKCHCYILDPVRRCCPWARDLLHQLKADRSPTMIFTWGEIGPRRCLLNSEVVPIHHRKPYSCSGLFKPNAVPLKPPPSTRSSS